MPPVAAGLAVLGGGSAAAGAGLALTGAAIGAGVYSANKDRETAKDLQESADQSRQASQDYIERNIQQARQDIFKLFPAASESRKAGVEAGLDLFRQSMPAQLGAFQQGNMGAQQMVSQGLPQFQNAILGQPVNQAAFQPQQLSVPGIAGLLNTQAPQAAGINAFYSQMQPPQNMQQFIQSAGQPGWVSKIPPGFRA